MRKKIIAFTSLLILTALGAVAANAQPGAPDIRVTMSAPASAVVYSPYVYKVSVKNIGGSSTQSVNVVVDFPLTDTSPTQYILGNVSGIDTSRCSVSQNKLNCNLGSLMKNKTKSFNFTFKLPVSTKTLEIKATGAAAGDVTPGNNVASAIPALAYGTNQITSANVLVSLCTGQGITSYFECELFPSTIQQFNATLDQGGSMTLPEPGYTGQWDQLISPQQLHWVITDGFDSATFNGFATGTTCFEGITTFSSNSNYVSPYRVCVQ
jgi:hypothetical protein